MTRHRLLVNTITILYICMTLIEFGTEIEFMVLVEKKKPINVRVNTISEYLRII